VQKITFDTSQIAGWDSSLVTFLIDIGGGHRNRQHYRRNGYNHGVEQCAGTLRVQGLGFRVQRSRWPEKRPV
jgi:hypothetical protein